MNKSKQTKKGLSKPPITCKGLAVLDIGKERFFEQHISTDSTSVGFWVGGSQIKATQKKESGQEGFLQGQNWSSYQLLNLFPGKF